jgi:extracellular factor (EF) 3-hydroxypalmitic acid methyl ester biosynthesis protein
VHRIHLRRQLHPLLLTSPFAYRTYTKPLGYAGDYEVVDMMLRPPYEGETLFAKLINVWLVGQAPAEAHRNRVTYLVRKLVEETVRVSALGRRAQVFNLGCGPADEVRRFYIEEAVSDHVALTLLDFNEKTITQLQGKLQQIKHNHRPGAEFHLIKKSVQQVLKDSVRAVRMGGVPAYDFVYCAGLFDYLTDEVCKRLMDVFYDMLAPGGLLVATNVSDAMNRSRPFRYSMEYILDWHLIYRNGVDFMRLAPSLAPPESVAAISDVTGVNVFIEVRKPRNG